MRLRSPNLPAQTPHNPDIFRVVATAQAGLVCVDVVLTALSESFVRQPGAWFWGILFSRQSLMYKLWKSTQWWVLAIGLLLFVGVGFRFVNLAGKVYWMDEVFSTITAAGYTRNTLDQAIFQNQIYPATDLQRYQRLKPNASLQDTLNVLILEDAKHPPLFFGLAHYWMRWVGDGMSVSRALPAFISLLSLPLMFTLAGCLFQSQQVAWLATVLLAVSPVDILFAQTVRQYSLLTAVILASHLAWIWAMRQQTWRSWGLYALSGAIGLYSHSLFLLTLMAHGVHFVGGMMWRPMALGLGSLSRRWVKYGVAIATLLLLYSPWLYILFNNHERTLSSSSWTHSPMEIGRLARFWLLSFTSPFFDLDMGFDHPGTYLLRLPFILLILGSIWILGKRTPPFVLGFISLSILVPFLMLALPDVLLGGRRSSVTRYLISCFPGIQLTVAFGLSHLFRPGLSTLSKMRQKLGCLLCGALITSAIASCSVSVMAHTWWSKGFSYFNADIIAAINATPSPLVISDPGSSGTNTANLISLSYGLKPEVTLWLLTKPTQIDLLETGFPSSEQTIFVYSPSQSLREALEILPFTWQQAAKGLWHLLPSSASPSSNQRP